MSLIKACSECGSEDFVKKGSDTNVKHAISHLQIPPLPLALALPTARLSIAPPFSTPPAPDALLCPLTGNGIIPIPGKGFLNVGG
jgi:hypothetical protein